MTEPIPSTYLTPRSGVPTRLSLSQELGFKVPTRFAAFVDRLFEFADGNAERCLDSFDITLGLFPGGREVRYAGTPPELFPIGRTGCDGDHYGFLLHAPELSFDDLPFAHYCPMDSDGVVLVGSTAERGLASVLSLHLSWDFVSAEEKTIIREIAQRCRFHLEVEGHPAISVPRGWRYLPSSDGVGTLAREDLFAPHTIVQFDQYGSPTPFVEAAEAARKEGYLATALHYLREGLWFCWVMKPYDLARRMVDVYNQMNRGKLAIELEHTMNRWCKAGDA